MQSELHLGAIDTHTAGMPTRIVTDGLNRSFARSGSVKAQRDSFSKTQDNIRELLIREPRGHRDMFGVIPTSPANNEADRGLFFMDHDGYLDMCGHATMGVVTQLLETNQIEKKETLKFETPAGIVEAYPECENGKVKRVGVKNVTSYVVDKRSISITVRGETTEVDTAIVYAGNYFAMVDAHSIGSLVTTENTKEFIENGLEIRDVLNEEHKITDPVEDKPITVDLVEFYDSSGDVDRNIVVFADGAVDRSPCGTGTCAKMTLLHDEGKFSSDDVYHHESIIGTRFEGEIDTVTTRNGVTVTTPIVWGAAYIIANHTFTLDPSDPKPSFNVIDH